MTLPARADSPLRTGWPSCWVFNNESKYASGWSSPVDISADGSQFDVTFVWVETGPPDSVVTFYRVRDPGTGELSSAQVPGYPVAGALDPPLLDVPAWTTPGPTDLHPLHDPVSWQLFDDVSTAGLRIYKDETILVWRIAAGANATTLTVPEPPSSVDVATHLGTAPLKARVWAVIEDDDRPGWRYSLSSKVRLVP